MKRGRVPDEQCALFDGQAAEACTRARTRVEAAVLAHLGVPRSRVAADAQVEMLAFWREELHARGGELVLEETG